MASAATANGYGVDDLAWLRDELGMGPVWHETAGPREEYEMSPPLRHPPSGAGRP